MLTQARRQLLLDSVCAAFETKPGMLADLRRRAVGTARARSALYALARAEGASNAAIGRWMGCHHTSVLYAIERHEQRMALVEGKDMPMRIWRKKKRPQERPADLRDINLCKAYAARYALAGAIAGVVCGAQAASVK